MGYTHYFKATKSIELQERQKELLKQVLEEHSDILEGGLMDDLLHINGIEEDGHEDLFVKLNSSFDFEFCKTNRKPYDLPVMKCLIVLSTLDGFSFSSDGRIDVEWKKALEWAHENDIGIVEEIGLDKGFRAVFAYKSNSKGSQND